MAECLSPLARTRRGPFLALVFLVLGGLCPLNAQPSVRPDAVPQDDQAAFEPSDEGGTQPDPGLPRGLGTLHQHVNVRGVVPFAGDLFAPEEHRDGQGTSARFRQAFAGVTAPVASGCGPRQWNLFVTDPRAHVLRRITLDGEVATFAGVPDQPGHQDSLGVPRLLGTWLSGHRAPPPRFNRPTYLVLREGPDAHGAWELRVSDNGNHVIRRVGATGFVETLAGTPGLAGYQDSGHSYEARFNDPQGIAVDAEGNTYVADRGNQVVRRIATDGGVTTLAGFPGLPGSDDGVQGTARFRNLKGLACPADGDRGGILYVLDGHAVRAVSYPGGVVTTVFGQVDTPGFQDVPPGEQARRDALQPCMNDPQGILCCGGALYLADTGNHAIRQAWPGQSALVTMVGAGSEFATRWGLLQEGLPGPFGPDYAALAAPTALVSGPLGPAVTMFACAGTGLVEISDWSEVRDSPAGTQVPVRVED